MVAQPAEKFGSVRREGRCIGDDHSWATRLQVGRGEVLPRRTAADLDLRSREHSVYDRDRRGGWSLPENDFVTHVANTLM
jgi:hypothetical protein